MPGKPRRKYGKKKKSTSKRTYRKKGRGYAVSPPRIMRVKLKYQDVYSTGTITSGSETYLTWRPNDTYDPLYTGAGHQSMFRDQWFGMYHWARCIGFKMKITLINTSANPVNVVMVGLQDSTAATYAPACEMKGAKKAMVTAEKPAVLYYKGYVDRFLCNKKGTALSDDAFKQGPSAALDVASTCWVHVIFKNFTSVSTELLVQYEILQMCAFSEQIIQAQS